ncbi:MAG: heat-shock protein Hsp20 [Proteobacteria bacterium HN_bin10]|nr:MAG: heat-shock protein Hsp20 [Proteobacteria bacterium HN_bin10]
MNLARWDPFRELEDMSHRLNRLLAGKDVKSQDGTDTMVRADWVPPVDISETDQEFQIKAELPGIKKQDIKVTLEGGILTLQGERPEEQEEKGRRIHRVERSYGRFVRSFTLPDVVDATKVNAEFKDGILTLRLHKSPAAVPKAIEVKVA